MPHDITPDTVAQHIYEQIICPTGNPQNAVNEWMDMTRGLACVLANGQRLAQGRPGYEAQTEMLTKAPASGPGQHAVPGEVDLLRTGPVAWFG